MNKMLKIVKVMMIVCAILIPAILMAQPGGGFDDDVLDNPVPFDGGVSLLVAAGIGYGIKKVRDSRKQQREQEL